MPRIAKNKETLLYPPYAKDLRNLLADFLLVSKFQAKNKKKSFSFQEFKGVWKTKSFSLIFDGKPEEVDYKLYTQELYTTCLGYLLFNNPNELRVGIVYTLYLLYHSQTSNQKVKINISIELYEELCKIEVYSRENKLGECYQIIQSLKQQKCLNFTASVRIDPLLSSLVAPKETSSQIPKEIIEENTLVIS